MKYRIKFSADDVSFDGTAKKEVIDKDYVLKINLLSANGRTVDEKATRKICEGSFQSKREGEKLLLQSLLSHALKDTKDASALYVVATLSAEIKDAEDEVLVDSKEFEEYIRKSIESIDKKDKEWWINFKELFKQIKSPEEVKEEPVKEKEE